MTDWLTYIFDNTIPFPLRLKRVYEYQLVNNNVYKRFNQALGIISVSELDISTVPLLPIEAFKDTEVKTGNWENADIIFKSSGTSSMIRSKHLVKDLRLYQNAIFRGFEAFYHRNDWCLLAYTPGYNENPDSSLVWMLNALISADDSGMSRFLPVGKALDTDFLADVQKSGKKIMLFGAAFGLLDLLEWGNVTLSSDSIIIETGGMKTYRREISRNELHKRLSKGFELPLDHIHSEYGMAEILSQAYATGSEWFMTPHWMKIDIRDPDNPLMSLRNNEEGLIGIIDLVNIHSCSFLLTGDIGIKRDDGAFKVLGRWKETNLRGCNFLIDQD